MPATLQSAMPRPEDGGDMQYDSSRFHWRRAGYVSARPLLIRVSQVIPPASPHIHTMNATDECAEVCNSLLRGELSAIETYTQAIGKFRSDHERAALQEIRLDHADSAAVICDHLVDMGYIPVTNSGAWGSFAKAVEGTAVLLGQSPALLVLKQGEEHGVDEYEAALRHPAVMDVLKTAIRQQLIPALDEHVAALDRLRHK